MRMLIAAAAVVVGLGLTGCGGHSGNDQQHDAIAICRTAIAKNLLKNPDSAQFRNVRAELGKWPDTNGGQMDYWDVTGEVSGQNSFGARGEFMKWACTAIPHKDGSLEVGQAYRL